MKKTLLVISSLLLVSVLSACGTAATPETPTTETTVTPAATTEVKASAEVDQSNKKDEDDISSQPKSPSVDEGDLYFKVLSSGDVKQCYKLTTELFKTQCINKLTAK